MRFGENELHVENRGNCSNLKYSKICKQMLRSLPQAQTVIKGSAISGVSPLLGVEGW